MQKSIIADVNLVNDSTLPSDNTLRFRKKILNNEYIYDRTMLNHDKIKEEKLQYYINREAGKRSTFPSKYEYLTGEEILSSN